MFHRWPVLLLCLWPIAVGLSSCSTRNTNPNTLENQQSSLVRSESLPDDLSVQVQNRAQLLSEGDAFLSFQMISRTPDPSANLRFTLTQEGEMRVDHHSGDVSEYSEYPFDREFSEAETRTISPEKMDQLHTLLKEPDFFREPIFQKDTAVEDGSYFVVAVRQDGRVHEVVFEAWEPPLVSFLWNLPY